MDREEILKLAEETGLLINQNKPIEGYEYKRCFYPEKIEAFANAIAAHEREECAKVCDKQTYLDESLGMYVTLDSDICAAAIRSRGTK